MDILNGELFRFENGDCVEFTASLPDECIDFSVFSPPFPDMYCYSDDIRDMGNSRNLTEMMQHFDFLVPELFRVVKQGRNVAIHCMDIPIQKGKQGFIGLSDFSGKIIESMTNAGFIYHSRVTIWKNPVTEMQRTKALGLLHKQVKKDSTMSRVGIPDYVLIFRKDGDRLNPVNCKISVDTWQQFASPVWQFDDPSQDMEMILPLMDKDEYLKLPADIRNKYSTPVWMDIDYGDTLNVNPARSKDDEKHICPLQQPTIGRLLTLYTNIGDIVYTPFGGIASEIYKSLEMDRKAIGVELKQTYHKVGMKNIATILAKKNQLQLL